MYFLNDFLVLACKNEKGEWEGVVNLYVLNTYKEMVLTSNLKTISFLFLKDWIDSRPLN